ncbi:MAG TPA: WG repeat-containing protein [Terriglobia bacterium]|nr:WG repeat-containing protein [Terriglobia bacterium]
MRTLIGYLLALILASPATSTTPAPPLKAKGSDPLYLFNDNGKWGYLDRNGAILIPAEFDAAADFFEGLAPVTRGDVKGYINASGRFEILRHESYLGPFRDGFAGVGHRPSPDEMTAAWP